MGNIMLANIWHLNALENCGKIFVEIKMMAKIDRNNIDDIMKLAAK
jgi:hypothetical protein